MLFSGIPFLYYFLPAVLMLYALAPLGAKNLVLLLASLAFYFYGEPVYTLLMLGTIFMSYLFGLLIDRFRGRRAAKLFLVLSVVSSLLVLGFFKYADFFISNTNSILHTEIPLLKLALPIGISFYTFQTLSYTIDVYRGDAGVQKSFIRLATYVAFFPQLIAGPIVRYATIEEQLTSRRHTLEDVARGISRFIYGLAKKILIANQLGELCDIFRGLENKSTGFYWLYAIAFTLHIYFDFSGYSDMAIGLGRIFGFHFPENFNYPLISQSISEFWRRWHISLGSWFRDYVYIPLGGNRVSTAKWLRNIFVVWLLTGFWHGADWTFIVWGLLFAVCLLLERLFVSRLLSHLPRLLRHVYVWLIILVSFVIFNANGLSQAGSDLVGMLGGHELPLWNAETTYYLRSYAVVLLMGFAGCCPAVRAGLTRLRERRPAAGWLEPVCLAVLLLVMTAYLVDGSFNPFLYFRF